MSHLSKLNLKTIQRVVIKDPVLARREKLVAAIVEQGRVLVAALAAEQHSVTVQRWQKDADGQRVKVSAQKFVRAWFFEQDSGYYVQCRYGSRVLNIAGKSNAVFVDKLDDVQAVLDAFRVAAETGELDKAVAFAMARAR